MLVKKPPDGAYISEGGNVIRMPNISDSPIFTAKLEFAELVAKNYAIKRGYADIDEALSVARFALVAVLHQAPNAGAKSIQRNVEHRIWSTVRREKRQSKIKSSPELKRFMMDRLGLSLNPPATIRGEFREEVGRITKSALHQTCRQHPGHRAYMAQSRENRARVCGGRRGVVWSELKAA